MLDQVNPRINSHFLKSLRQENTSYTPIWLMRQAGRYLPEYQSVRKKSGGFLALCKTPELACEVTIQPLRRFQLDAGIIFSDILTIPDAMGLGLEFIEGKGPIFQNPIRHANEINNLNYLELNHKLDYVFSAISLTRNEMPSDIPLIGFSGSPFTIACYMIEGKSSKEFLTTKKFLSTNSNIFTNLLEKLTVAITNYLLEQINRGVDVIQIFDTWGGILPETKFVKFSLEPITKITKSIKKKYPDIPIIIFTKTGDRWLEKITIDAKVEAISIDSTVDIGKAFTQINNRAAIQGNLDPNVLLANRKILLAETKNILQKVDRARSQAFEQNQRFGHIFNLGHGILPQAPPDNVKALVDYVHNFKINQNHI